MTSRMIKRFESLRNAVAEDGKIDVVELNVLKNYIEPYCKAGNKDFYALNNILSDVDDDNSINDEESAKIIAALDNVLVFLKRESRFENIVTTVIALIVVSIIGIALFVH